MQFIVLGYDGTDEAASERRMTNRPLHLERIRKQRTEGKVMYAAAFLDDQNRMIGSMIVYEYESKEALEAALEEEPYVTGSVWETIEIKTAQIPPLFEFSK